MIKRRSAIEPTIGHMKTDGRLARNPLKGALGDALHAVLCGAGHNIRLLLKKLRLLLTFIVWAISGARPMNYRAHQLAVGCKRSCSGRTP
jgi:IS5 family transposase